MVHNSSPASVWNIGESTGAVSKLKILWRKQNYNPPIFQQLLQPRLHDVFTGEIHSTEENLAANKCREAYDLWFGTDGPQTSLQRSCNSAFSFSVKENCKQNVQTTNDDHVNPRNGKPSIHGCSADRCTETFASTEVELWQQAHATC